MIAGSVQILAAGAGQASLGPLVIAIMLAAVIVLGAQRLRLRFRKPKARRESAKYGLNTPVAGVAREEEAGSERRAHGSSTPPGEVAARRLAFDPEGPEKAGSAAKIAYAEGHWFEAFNLSVVAIDRLHDFYVFEQFRNRQPSPRDAWLVDGLTASICIVRKLIPDADVREGVRTATHRLRTIAHAFEQAGGNAVLYRRALDELGRCAGDIDVSDIFWT